MTVLGKKTGPKAVFDSFEAIYVRDLFRQGWTQKQIVEGMGKGCQATVNHVLRGKGAYDYLDGPVVRPDPDERRRTPKTYRKLTVEKIKDIKEVMDDGILSAKEIAAMYDVNVATVHHIAKMTHHYTPEAIKRRKI